MTEKNTPKTDLSRRQYLRASVTASGLAFGVGMSTTAVAEPPGFTGRIYADNDVWATRGVADLPFPNDNNEQSYDELFPSPGIGLLAVAEAAPGSPDYNGGRWAVHPLTWHVEPKQLKSYTEIQQYVSADKISFPDDPVDAFECPLVRINE